MQLDHSSSAPAWPPARSPTPRPPRSYSVTATSTDTDGNYTGSSGSDGPVPPGTACLDHDGHEQRGLGHRGHLRLHRHRRRPNGTPAGSVAWTGSACQLDHTPQRRGGHLLGHRRPGHTAYSETATFTDTDGNYTGSAAKTARYTWAAPRPRP